ncbi:glyoxylase-like metal-dependent hydrolase (beta-lactamase superfamily II) [Kitasatospora sp. GAS204A]|uniref:MBL fold metallo-hydrolase n=1 Tax=unclassified Kitasatospora TaxID=2633591 RepID=UPI0024732347|nr:MBL fold metallo-hydrolase [Kitasatospora sp. GAS204B]MDH6119536.1 glyoxylase-like metal-dependent hydrolase (beta-lactamase superfamily II) [Kitasatospora sp. GAS204B]
MEHLMVGEVEVGKVVERQGSFLPAATMFPQLPPEAWRDNREWLAPNFWEPESGLVQGAVQTWVLRSEGRTILVDTGVGNGRHRPHTPQFADWDTDFLDQLAAAGVQPADVDVVVNTHLHADHVGWNTEWRGGSWQPTFPNARYLVPAPDFAAAGNADPESGKGHLYADSIAPVHRAGQVELWSDGYRIDGNLALEAAPGHTPGSAVLRLASGGDRAVFVGDLLHSPLQILEPARNSCFCEDPARAAASRRRVLERAADQGELVVPAHFGGTGIAEMRRAGDTFAITGWAGAAA